MVIVKADELKDYALDWAVAKALGHHVKHYSIGYMVEEAGGQQIGLLHRDFNVSKDWSLFGPIIDKEHIGVENPSGTLWSATQWMSVDPTGLNRSFVFGSGQTLGVAALRCFVSGKLGPKIKVPGDLLNYQRPSTAVIR